MSAISESSVIAEAARLRAAHGYTPAEAHALAELMAIMSGPHAFLICADEFDALATVPAGKERMSR